MLRKILVPLDGSRLADEALRYATALSIPTATRLILMRVADDRSWSSVDASSARHAAAGGAARYLLDVAAQLTERGFQCETVVAFGDPAEEIAVEAHLRGTDLVVMSTHGRTGPQRWLFGSIAEKVIAAATVPVLVVRGGNGGLRQRLLEKHPRLLVPVDESLAMEKVIEVAASLAEDLNGELLLLQVRAQPLAGGRPATTGDRREHPKGEDAAERVARGLRLRHPSVPFFVLEHSGEIENAVASATAHQDVALVVIGAHRRGGKARTAVGDLTGRVLQRSAVPLVLVPPITPDEAGALATDGEPAGASA